MLLVKRLEINAISKEESSILKKQVFKANLADDNCFILRFFLETDQLATKIESCHFCHLSINLKNCLY